MASPTVDDLLKVVAGLLREKNGIKLQDVMLLEPPLPPLYNTIVSELRRSFPASSQDALEAKCTHLLPEYEEGDEGGSWISFITFTAKYFAFLRDVDVNDLVGTHDMLKSLLKLVEKRKLHESTMG